MEEIRKYFFLCAMSLVASCNVSERPISYGTDDCDYCKMIIMDHRYGSELVTQKGKVYTFDAAECLIDFLYDHEEVSATVKYLLVTPYTQPDHLIDATSATFLVSREMPSPMGAYLTAFSERDTAAAFQREKGGDLYTWQSLYKDFRAIKRNVIKAHE